MSAWDKVQAALDADEVVLLPTETVYGLTARADSAEGISKIYALKGRDFDKPLAVCVRDLAQAERLALFDETARKLADRYWPGPLTLVLDAAQGAGLDPRVMAQTASGPTLAMRCPIADWRDHLTQPLALTSANPSGQPDAKTYAEALDFVGEHVGATLQSNVPLSGSPSTIIRVADGTLTVLRQGGLIITEVSS